MLKHQGCNAQVLWSITGEFSSIDKQKNSIYDLGKNKKQKSIECINQSATRDSK